MKSSTGVERGKLKADRRIFSKLGIMRKSSMDKETKSVLIASLHHCGKVQYITLLCPLLLPWKLEAHSLLYSGQSRKFLAGVETFREIAVKNLSWFSTKSIEI